MIDRVFGLGGRAAQAAATAMSDADLPAPDTAVTFEARDGVGAVAYNERPAAMSASRPQPAGAPESERRPESPARHGRLRLPRLSRLDRRSAACLLVLLAAALGSALTAGTAHATVLWNAELTVAQHPNASISDFLTPRPW